eukprot:366121-Chlamydomonas_euryale.AAC.7
MQRSSSRPLGNVFEEASRLWELRQEAIGALQQEKPKSHKVDFGFWGTGSLQREDRGAQRGAAGGEQAEEDGAGGREARRIAGLAVEAAKAAQLWRASLRSRNVLSSVSDSSSGSSSDSSSGGGGEL